MAFLCETPAEKGSCPGQDYKMEKADGKGKKSQVFALFKALPAMF